MPISAQPCGREAKGRLVASLARCTPLWGYVSPAPRHPPLLSLHAGHFSIECNLGQVVFTLARFAVNSELMNKITPDQVQQFLVTKYSRAIREMGFDPAKVPESFDFFLSGVVDSFGILEMVTSIEDQFQIQLDMATLDAEQITILGPLSRYVAGNAKPT